MLRGGTPAYIMEHISRLGDVYDQALRPNGYICLAIAENKISFRLLRDHLQVARTHDSIATTCYDDPRGSRYVREAVAALLTDHVMKRKVDAESVVCTTGATGVLNQLLFCTCCPGDSVIIPAPYYTGFDTNIADPRLKLKTHPLHIPAGKPHWDIDSGISRANLEGARVRIEEGGGRVGALLLTNPHNPTGLVYGVEALRGAVAWAEARGITVVVDEVYALSVHGGGWGDPPPGGIKPFRSVVSMFAPLRPNLHVIWGFSKDFGCAGWRVGVLVTENSQVNAAVRGLVHPSESSTDTLSMLARLIGAPGFAPGYSDAHRRNLAHAYGSVSQALLEAGIDFLPNTSGLFVLLDLRKHLPSPDFAGEDALWRRILDACNVNLTPGSAMHCREVGWYRLCFAYWEPAVVKLAVRRLSAVVGVAEWRQRNRSLSG